MDRNLTKQEINAQKRKQFIRIGIPAVAVIAVIAGAIIFSRDSVNRRELNMALTDRGTIESSVTATGKVVPAFEQAITSPITARIVEVYCNPGDSLEEGTPLLLLDLQSTQTEVDRQQDQRQKQVYEIEQQRLDNETRLTSLEMQIRVKEMAVDRLKTEVANEKRLDSIGSGTGDRVREAELAYRTGRLELEQLRKQLANERKALAATLKSRNLDLSIFDKNYSEQLRTLEDARLRSPRAAVLTYINNNVGEQVQQGEKIAAIADLSHFRIDGEIAETHGKYLTPGGRATVRLSKEIYPGRVINVTPVSSGGTVKFSVMLDNDTSDKLRSGLSVEIFVTKEMKPDVVRLPMGSYYTAGPGEYELYVEESPGELTRRKVTLGDANYDYVEVKSGLQPGEKVVISSMTDRKKKKYKIND